VRRRREAADDKARLIGRSNAGHARSGVSSTNCSDSCSARAPGSADRGQRGGRLLPSRDAGQLDQFGSVLRRARRPPARQRSSGSRRGGRRRNATRRSRRSGGAEDRAADG
jgi:hypothetical protein